MKQERIHPLQVKDLVFPFIRPLASIFSCLREMEDTGYERPSDSISGELTRTYDYILKSLEKLSLDGEITDDTDELRASIERMKECSCEKQEIIRNLNRMNELLTTFCRSHKTELRTAYNSDKDYYRNLHRELVGQRIVCLIHGRNDAEAASSIVKTLSGGCYYDVDLVPVTGCDMASYEYDVVSFFTLDPGEITKLMTPKKQPPVSMILINLGNKINEVNPTLLRIAGQMKKEDVTLLYRPFSTLRLLQEFERMYFKGLFAGKIRGEKIATVEMETAQQDASRQSGIIYDSKNKKADLKAETDGE